MTDQPLVSILLLSMNHEPFIEQCISSIANQTYKNIEVVYVDNASSDNSFEKGKKQLEDAGLPHKCFSNKTSKTISANLNFLFDHSSGDFVSPLSTDDWFEPTNIQIKVEFLQADPGVGAMFSNGWIYLQEEGKTILNDATRFKRGFIRKEVLTETDCIFYVGMIYRRAIIDEVGKWDESLFIEDTDMFIRIGSVANIDFLPAPLVYYRRTSSSASKNKKFMLEGFTQYYEKYKHVTWINMKKWLAERYRNMAASDINDLNLKHAGALLKKSFQLNPFSIKNYQTLFYLIRRSIKS